MSITYQYPHIEGGTNEILELLCVVDSIIIHLCPELDQHGVDDNIHQNRELIENVKCVTFKMRTRGKMNFSC